MPTAQNQRTTRDEQDAGKGERVVKSPIMRIVGLSSIFVADIKITEHNPKVFFLP